MSRLGGASLLALVLTALSAPAAEGSERGLAGFGRAFAGVGWRLTPNDYFFDHARELQFPPLGSSPGGPALCLCFSYAATEVIEVAIDLHLSGEKLRLAYAAPITSITYGALLGVRVQGSGLLGGRVVPYVGLFTGPSLVYVTSEDFRAEERVSAAWAGNAGFTVRLGERYGLTLDYKLLLARGWVPGIGSINGGGSLITLGLSVYFPPEPSPGGSWR